MSFFLLHCKLVEELSVPPERLMTLWPWWVNSSEETNIGIWCILKRKRYYTFWNPSRYILGIKKCLTWLRRSLWSHLFKLFVSSHRFWSDLLLRRQTWKTAWPHSHQRVVETLLSKTALVIFTSCETRRGGDWSTGTEGLIFMTCHRDLWRFNCGEGSLGAGAQSTKLDYEVYRNQQIHRKTGIEQHLHSLFCLNIDRQNYRYVEDRETINVWHFCWINNLND